jgi:predicted nucleotidyltransferase component of viral defense system
MNKRYLDNVRLLLRILPEIGKIEEFALHGGTAINLFHNNMPRLSVDIDLTYIPFSDRETDLRRIKDLLEILSSRLSKTIPDIIIRKQPENMDEVKLFCNLGQQQVKIEVNTINRGLIGEIEEFGLCSKAQQVFNMYCTMRLVPREQLFGGKIIAALDRQHPRDIFDTMNFFNKHSFDDKFVEGFIFCLFSSKRPLSEILMPNFTNQSNLIETQFAGMTDESFTYEIYSNERERLLYIIKQGLSELHKNMILKFAENEPFWMFADWSSFPGIAWKMRNIANLRTQNPTKFSKEISLVKQSLGMI